MAKSDNSTPYTASVYDTQIHSTIPYYDAFHQETINLIKTMQLTPRRWLDTGCGTGTFVQKALSKFPETHFVLSDPSAEMLQAAKKKLAALCEGRVQFLEPAATQDLPVNVGDFDVVTAIQSHHYVQPAERVKATKVCHRLLAPGGVYVTFENIRPLTPEGVAVGKQNWGSFQLKMGRSEETVRGHLARFDVEYHPITLEEHLSLLRKTGFRTVELLWYSVMQAGFYAVK